MKTSVKVNDREIQAFKKKFQEALFEVSRVEYKKLARMCVTSARGKTKADGGFNDQTGNLRSSMGYILMYDGKQVEEDFEGAVLGKSVGKKYANKVSKDYPRGWAIIIVVDMNYGRYVEALGYDVITGSTLGMKAKFDAAHKAIAKALKDLKL